MNSFLNRDQIIYSLDTSALIAAFHERYPIENFPSLWRKIEELIKNDRLKMSQIVFDEAMRDTDIKQWCDEYQLKPYFQVPIDEFVQEQVSKVLSEFPRLVDNRTGRSGADPWVIALAMITQNCIVVTEENPTNSENRPKIPDACAHFNLQCIKVVDLIKEKTGSLNRQGAIPRLTENRKPAILLKNYGDGVSNTWIRLNVQTKTHSIKHSTSTAMPCALLFSET